MEELSRIEAAFRVLRDKGKHPNFLFIGGGLSDVSQFDAFALYANDLGIELCGVLYDSSAQDSSNRFDEEHVLGIEPAEYELVHRIDEPARRGGSLCAFKEMVHGCFVALPSRFRGMGSLRLDDLWKVQDPFFLIQPKCGFIPPYALRFLAAVQQNDIIHIALEEGIGSYLMTPRDWWLLGVDRELDPLMRILKAAVLHLLWPMKKRQQLGMSQRMTLVSYTLFAGEGGVLRKNAIPCRYFGRALEDMAAQRDIPVLDFSNVVIIATTRFADFEASDFERDCLRIVISILRAYSYRVILRPHPAEKMLEHYEGLDAEMDPYMDVSLEVQIAASQTPPVAILGFMSSSQLIASALWGIEAICISEVLDEEWKSLSKSNSAVGLLNREIEDAKALFRGYVRFPCGVQQLESEIASLKRRACH